MEYLLKIPKIFIDIDIILQIIAFCNLFFVIKKRRKTLRHNSFCTKLWEVHKIRVYRLNEMTKLLRKQYL